MSEGKDPAIKLFGKTIPLPESPPPESDLNGAGEGQDCDEAPSCQKQSDSKHDDENRTFTSSETTDPNQIALTNDNLETEEEQTEKTILKKPDKMLPCPRCNSIDTKFCYYNNYNTSQPRHFCRKCQRYWTAGGTMRNVPIGAGRRKNKTSASHYSHITISEALYNAQVNAPAAKPNGAVLTFGSDSSPLCESMASVLIVDKMEHDGDNSDNQTSPTIVSNVEENERNDVMMENCHAYPPQVVPVFTGPPWPYPTQWVPPPGVFPPGYPMPFYPPPLFWGPWIAPWVPPPPSTSPNSPTLGKHSRDENSSLSKLRDQGNNNSIERSLWVPKTLRIDDPEEAAKSSIWSTLGIKHGKGDLSSGVGGKGRGLFKAFRSKGDEKSDSSTDTSAVLQANPAALSRSRNFHEN